MNAQKTGSLLSVTLITLILCSVIGCDDRKMERKGDKLVPQTSSEVITEHKPSQKPAAVVERKEPEEAVLHIIEKDGTVTVRGSIKGRYDKKDMMAVLIEKLPDMEIIDELETSIDRIAMGWEGRMAERLLIPLINSVENAELHYETGVVRVEGVVTDQKIVNAFQKAVVNTIYGPYSTELKNNLRLK